VHIQIAARKSRFRAGLIGERLQRRLTWRPRQWGPARDGIGGNNLRLHGARARGGLAGGDERNVVRRECPIEECEFIEPTIERRIERKSPTHLRLLSDHERATRRECVSDSERGVRTQHPIDKYVRRPTAHRMHDRHMMPLRVVQRDARGAA